MVETKSVLAVDNDPQAAKTFALNYGRGDVIKSPKEAAFLRQVHLDADSFHQTFQCDDRSGWWCQFVPKIDILAQSPPCPAWSLAHIAHGLSRADGFLTIESFLKTTLLQPEIVCFENVANLRTHAHFAIIRDVLDWLGWRIRWADTVNLNDILPQNRERLLMVLARADATAKADFQFRPWVPKENVNLHNCDILRPKECLAHCHVPELSSEVLRLYIHPEFIPGDRRSGLKAAKAYRLRRADQTVSCIMAHYGFSHELGLEVLRQNGLFGNLIIDHDIVRWLAIPEICNLMGIIAPWKTSLDLKACLATRYRCRTRFCVWSMV